MLPRIDPAWRFSDQQRDGLAEYLVELLGDAPEGGWLAEWLMHRLMELGRITAHEQQRMELLQHELDVGGAASP